MRPERFEFLFECEVDRHVVKKNSRPIFRAGRRAMIGKSKELVNAEKFLEKKLIIAAAASPKEYPIAGPYHVAYIFVFGPDRSREYKLCDLSNLIELPQDCLQKAGIIKNDRFIQSLDGTRKLMGDRTFLRIEIMRYDETVN